MGISPEFGDTVTEIYPHLGCCSENEEVIKVSYYDEDEEVIKKAVKAENVTYSDDLITCNINLDKDSVVLLSIPYSDGWSVTIDDTPVKVYNSNIYYIAVDAIKGSHTIRYSYSAYR